MIWNLTPVNIWTDKEGKVLMPSRAFYDLERVIFLFFAYMVLCLNALASIL